MGKKSKAWTVQDRDEEGDILYISFIKGRKATGVTINENILLRFDPQTKEAVGLTLIDFSTMLPTDGNPTPTLSLKRLNELPDKLRAIVWDIITRPPVSIYLALSTSESGPSVRIVEAQSVQPFFPLV